MTGLLQLSIALYFSIFFADAEAKTYKCANGRKITYANVPCEDMGLKSVGPVKNLVTVLPATPVAEKSAGEDKMTDSESKKIESVEDETGVKTAPHGNAIKPVNPLVKKMLDM